MKLGTGKIEYKFKFKYEFTNSTTTENVYADTLEEAKELFADYYKEHKSIRILSIEEV